ncbi:MAG: TonB-dependent receptor, partial [Verrucomicrobia bacterium]|nr:TonB-dependent receptor [Cytophagales bacterium]
AGLYAGQGFTDASGNQVFPNRNLDFSKAHHYVLAHNLLFANGLRLKTEAYYQYLYNIPVSSGINDSFSALNVFDGFVGDVLTNKGTGRNFGVEVSAQKPLEKNFYYLISASVYDAKYRGSDNVLRNARYNGNYAFAFTGGKEFVKEKEGKNRVIGLNVRALYQGGFRATPVDTNASIAAQQTVFIETQAFSQQLQDYFRIDLRISLKKNKPNYTRLLALDLQNALGTQNVAYQYFDTQKQQIVTRFQLGLTPNLSYRIEF